MLATGTRLGANADGATAYASVANPKNLVGELRAIDLRRRTSGEPKLLFTLADRISDVSVMRDGSFLLVLTNEASAIQPIRLLINAQ
jgi:hypothetical protein